MIVERFNEIKEEIGILKSDVGTSKSDVKEVKTEIKGLLKKVNKIEAEVKNIRTDLKEKAPLTDLTALERCSSCLKRKCPIKIGGEYLFIKNILSCKILIF